MTRAALAPIVFGLGTVLLAMTLGGNFYEQLICVPGWRAPGGLEAWRAFTASRHAGYFFLSLAPASLLCLSAGTALGWNLPAERNVYALAATAIVLAGLVFTRIYFIPRNLLIFLPATATHDAALANLLLEQWVAANRIRVALVGSGLVSALIALRK